MLVELEEQLEAIKKAEETRNSLVENLIAKVRELCVERGELQSKLEQAEDLRDVYHDKLKHARSDFNELERKMTANPFCLVLIDADNTLFCDGYIKRGSLGGREAAIHLMGNLTRLLKAQENFQPYWKLIVRLYASLSKLGEAYVKSSVLADVSIWRAFVQSFNKEIPLCEFIDAGSDRDSADNRIKETFNLFQNNVHCKHIVLAASGDNGYTGFLRQFAPATGISETITLIEARPFPAQLRQIANSFQVETLPTMFRASDLIASKSSPTQHNLKLVMSTNDPVSSGTTNKTMAEVVANTRTQAPASALSVSTSGTNRAKSGKVVRICFNESNHRLDPIVRYDKQLISQLKAKKLCETFFLSKCDFLNCKYDHNGNLNQEELNTLRYIAKQSPCQSVYCQRPYCVSGHICPYDGKCAYGKNCKFPASMHNVDAKVDSGRTIEVLI